MARGGSSERTSDLYIRLGLSTDELESGFVAADRTLRDNMARLNRENTIVNLQAQVEISGLDESADATRILEVRQRALQRRIEIQRDRVRLASAALNDMAQQHGANSDQAQRASIAHERERMSLARLEQQLRQTQQAQEELNSSAGVGGLSNLVGGVLDKIPPQAEMAAEGIAALGSAIIAAGKAPTELIEKWRELQQQSYELNMSVNDTENFLRHMRLAGGDIGDFEGFIRGITDAYVKGEWDDPEFIELRKFGANIVDATGRLKNFQEITEEVYQAYKKAKESGEEIEFLQLLGGEAGVRDAIQYFERYEEAKEDAEKIFDAGLDPEEMHEADRALNLLTEQMEEFKDAAVNLVTPATTATMKGLFEVFRSGTEFLTENKDALQKWGGVAANVIFPFTNLISVDDVTEKATEDHIKKVLEAGQKLEKAREKLKEGAPTTQYGWQRLNDLRDELKDVNAEIENFKHGYDLELAQLDLWKERAYRQNDLSKQERLAIEELYARKRVQIEQEAEDKLDDIRNEATAEFKGDLEKRYIEIENAMDDWIDAGMKEAEAEVLAQNLKSKALKDALEELNSEAANIEFAQTHSEFEQELRNIEIWKQAQLDKASTAEEVAATIANAAMKEADAFEKEVDRMRGKIESAQDKLARLTLSQRDNDIYQAQKEYYQGIQEGLPKEFADAIYNAQMAAIKKRTKEDKSGSYKKRPEAAQNGDTYSQLLDFTKINKQLNNTAESLVKLDAEEVARAEVLKKSALSIVEIERSVNKADNAMVKLSDSNLALANANSQAKSAGEQATQELQDTADSAKNFGGTLQNVNSAIDKNISALQNATSATGTFAEGLANVADIEAQKEQDKVTLPNVQPKQKPQGEQIEIIYGDRDDDYFESNDEIPVLYGKFADLGNATENLSADMQGVNLDSLEQINASAEKAAESLAQVEPQNIQQAVTKAADSVEMLGDKFAPFTTALDSVTNSLQQAAEKIAGLEFKAPQIQNAQAPQPIQNDDEDTINMVLDAAQTFGKGLSMASLLTTMGTAGTTSPVTLPLAVAGSGIEILADIAQQIYNANKEPQNNANFSSTVDLPNFEAFNFGLDKSVTSLDTFSKALLTATSKFEGADVSDKNIVDISPITQELVTLTQIAGSIAQEAQNFNQQKQPPVVNVNPTITVNLAGAYVFDNAMKAELTEDITENVANGITEAVTKAANEGIFGFND